MSRMRDSGRTGAPGRRRLRGAALSLALMCGATSGCSSDETAAPPAALAVRLGLAFSGDGRGLITSDPNGLACSTNCDAAFAPGAQVELTATADPGSAFAGWSGACTGSQPTCMLTLPAQPGALSSASASFRPAPDPMCSSNGICWSDPRPLGANWNAVWAFGPHDVWVVGSSGGDRDPAAMVHFDGTSWTRIDPGFGSNLRALWASGPDDLWAVGASGTALHFDGHRFTSVGPVAAADLNGVWSTRGGDVWVAAGNGQVYRHGPGGWTATNPGTGQPLNRISGTAPDDIWVASDSGEVVHWDGSRWGAPRKVATGALRLSGLYAAARNDVWALDSLGHVMRFDGKTWAAGVNLPGGFALNLLGTASGEVLVTSTDGQLARWDRNARSWQLLRYGTSWLMGGHADPSGTVWVVGQSGALARLDGNQLVAPPDSVQVFPTLPSAVWAASPRAVFMVGSYGAVTRWDGTAWSRIDVSGGQAVMLSAVFGTSERDVWAVGDDSDVGGGAAFHWNGASWQRAVLPGTVDLLTAGWASSPQDAWAVGYDSTFLHFDGIAWSRQPTPASGDEFAIWGSSSSDIWAGGTSQLGDGELLHFDGMSWSLVPNLTIPDSVFSLGGSGPSDVWLITGENDAVLHYDGTAWQRKVLGLDARGLNGVWASSARDVWIGSWGQVVHYDGQKFSALSTGTESGVRSISGSGPESVWFATRMGLLRYQN